MEELPRYNRKLAISAIAPNPRIAHFCSLDPEQIIRTSLIGLEKESLRITADGSISQSRHPAALGSALTHSAITTDYSEALMELVTSPHDSIAGVLGELNDIHSWVYQNLGDELLWNTSMPCLLAGEESIPIAQYGPSNMGMMKTVYRRGLGHRYGKMMQVIAGVHFNYSFPQAFWDAHQALAGSNSDTINYRSTAYMSTMRNLQRVGWLIPYLFGASPAVCESFLVGQETSLQPFGHGTYYEPYATSLRLGDIGYQNKKEGKLGVQISDDTLEEYIATLEQATSTPCPCYEDIGIQVDGEYRQLSINQMQIENEYYTSVRAKAAPGHMEKPVRTLQRKGIEYLELRSLDVDVFEPVGVSATQLHFLEPLMIYAALQDSSPISAAERANIDNNMSLVAHCGRDPELCLSLPNGQTTIREWASNIMNDMTAICAWLDQGQKDAPYTQALKAQQSKIYDASSIPSTQIIETLRSEQQSFFHFSVSKANETAEYFRDHPLTDEKAAQYQQSTEDSLAAQQAIDDAPQQPFDQFLAEYFAQ